MKKSANKKKAVWAIHRSAAGERPSFPGLRADARDILVAPQAIIRLREKNSSARALTLGDCLARVLGGLSYELSLSESVRLRKTHEGDEAFVVLTPPDTSDLSRLYDAVAAASALSNGSLYIGQGRAFIRYRDAEAARGYDAAGVQLPRGDDLFLLDKETTHSVSVESLDELSLPEVLLATATLPAREVELPDRAFAMVAMPLYHMIARYLRDHHLSYRVARFHTTDGETLMLFEMTARHDAPTGAHVPAYVLNYLESLPRSVVLTEAWADEGRRMLVEWGRRYPGNARNVLKAFVPGLVLFSSGRDYPNLSVAPMPTFFEGDDVTTAQAGGRASVDLRPLHSAERLPLELPVRLVEDTGSMPHTSALILDEQETNWVKRLLYRLPGEAFNAYTMCVGEGRAVLVAEGMAVESLPFGIALQRVQDTQLFIPLRTRFAPDLPWGLLAQALDLKDGVYTFLTEEFRLDIPRAAFTPLARALVTGKERSTQAFTVVTAKGWPELDWKPRPQPNPAWRSMRETGSVPRESQRQSVFGRIRNERTTPAPEQPPKVAQANAPRRAEDSKEHQPSQPLDEAALFRRRAESFLQSGDHLSAAFCFSLAGDNYNAARSFQEAARRIKDEGQALEETAG
ncbi:MAG TPA: hypothetical protein VF735_04300 [Pyrinomonadaceae bacterium]